MKNRYDFYGDQNLLEIYSQILEKTSLLKADECYCFEVTKENGSDFKKWVDLAELLLCRLAFPEKTSQGNIRFCFEKLDTRNSFHEEENDIEKKYGSNSLFSKVKKNTKPSFLVHYLKALENVKIDTRLRILNLGVNSGEEFQVIVNKSKNFQNLELVGVDYCASAIQEAQKKFALHKNITFIQGDINHLEDLHLGTFDLIISIGTLQSSNLNFRDVFQNIVQNYLKKEGAMILGFPNCRWIDGQMIYGAWVKNYNFSELSLLFKDISASKRYLQQKKFRVTLTGKEYIFLTATSIRKSIPK